MRTSVPVLAAMAAMSMGAGLASSMMMSTRPTPLARNPLPDDIRATRYGYRMAKRRDTKKSGGGLFKGSNAAKAGARATRKAANASRRARLNAKRVKVYLAGRAAA